MNIIVSIYSNNKKKVYHSKESGFSLSSVLIFALLIALIVIPASMQYQFNQQMTANTIFIDQIYNDALSESLQQVNPMVTSITPDDLNIIIIANNPKILNDIGNPNDVELETELAYQRNIGPLEGYSIEHFSGEYFRVVTDSDDILTQGESIVSTGILYQVENE